jgi:serine/threonine-protein kinase
MKAEVAKAAQAPAKVDVTFGIAPGTVLAERYEILEKCGEGGFAVVYRARQLSTRREVALKHLRPDVLGAQSDRVHLERFERETKLIGELNHPNVVRLIDSGSVPVRMSAPPPKAHEDEGASQTRKRHMDGDAISVPYIVMELLTGESVADLIDREAPLEPARAVDLMLPVLSALHAAHEKGVVHRDVKPSNIMLTDDGHGGVEPKVLDFGIAKLTKQDESDLTITSSLIGTPRYMPPEQAYGKKDLDARVDQFATAAVLYQMLTARPLYTGESYLELVSNVLSGAFTPLAEAKPDLPADLVAVVTRALAAKREERHRTMMSFGRALLPFASERGARHWSDRFAPTSDAPPSEAAPAPKPSTPPATVANAVVEAPAAEPEPPAPPVATPRIAWGHIALVAALALVVSYLLARYL